MRESETIVEGGILNISSIIVHPGPGLAGVVRTRLLAMAGVEGHVETEGEGAMIDAFEAVNKTEGVLSASMVYHQTEANPDAEISVGT